MIPGYSNTTHTNIIIRINIKGIRVTSSSSCRTVIHKCRIIIINNIAYILLPGTIPKIGCIICRNNIIQNISCVIDYNGSFKIIINTSSSHRNIRMATRTIPILCPYGIKTRAIGNTRVKHKVITSICSIICVINYFRFNITNNLEILCNTCRTYKSISIINKHISKG